MQAIKKPPLRSGAGAELRGGVSLARRPLPQDNEEADQPEDHEYEAREHARVEHERIAASG